MKPSPSEQPRAIGNKTVGGEQDDVPVVVGKTQRQHFGHRRADLARREVDHRRDLSPGQLVDRVIRRDLRAAFPHADARAEIDFEAIGRLARLGEFARRDDRADADIGLQKIGKSDPRGGRRGGIVVEMHVIRVRG